MQNKIQLILDLKRKYGKQQICFVAIWMLPNTNR